MFVGRGPARRDRRIPAALARFQDEAAEAASSWKSRLGLIEGERDTALASLKTSQGDLATLRGRYTGLEAELNACGDARSNLEGRLADWIGKGKAWDGERATMTAEAGALQASFNESAARLEADASGLRSSLSAASGAVAGWVAKSALWDGDKAKLDGSLAAANSKVAALEAEAAKLRASGDAASASVAAWVAKSAQWDADKAKLQDVLTAASSRASALEGDLKTAHDARAAANGRLAELENDAKALRTSLDSTCAKLPVLEAAIAGWAAKSLLWDAGKSKLEGDLRTATDALTGANGRIGGLEGDLRVANDALAAANGRIGALEGDASALRSNLDAVTAKLQAEVSAAKTDKTDTAKLAADLEGWKRKYLGMEAQRNQLLADGTWLRRDLGIDSAARQALEKQRLEWTGKFRSWDAEREALRTRVAELESGLGRAIADDHTDDAAYEKQIAAWKTQIAAVQADLNATVDRLRVASEERESTAAAILRMKQDDRAEGDRYEAEIARLKSELAESTASADGWTAKYQALEAGFAAPAAMAAAAGAGAGTASSYTPPAPKPEIAGDIHEIEGIGLAYAAKMRAYGIYWIRTLLAEGADPEGRAGIVEGAGIRKDLVLKWVNAADLLRIEGMTPDWAELLEESGVDTVKELRARVPANLHKKLAETNAVCNFARTVPGIGTVEKWVLLAGQLRPKLTY